MILTARARGCGGDPAQGARSRRAPPRPRASPRATARSAGVYETIEVKVPDIGDFKDVPVIEVHVADGAVVKAEDPLLTLESDKATMDVPAPAGGHGDRAQGQGRRPGQRGQPDPDAADRRGQAGARPRPAPAPAATAPTPKPASGRQGRLPRRGAGAGRRPRRLHRGLPRRRPRPQGGAGRALADAGRGLPQCRLHPLQGAAARRQGDRRDQGDGPPRHQLRRAHGRHRRAARLEGRRGQEADRRPRRASPRRAR